MFGDTIYHHLQCKEHLIKTIRTLILAVLLISSLAVIIKILPTDGPTDLPMQCVTDPSIPDPETYNISPINEGFKEYYLKVYLKPFPENAILLYKGNEVGFTKFWLFGGHKIDWGVDIAHVHQYGEDYVIFGIGTLWSWMPQRWGWQNAENWEIIVPCP